MNRKILLVDGNSIMNRAFYAVYGRAPMTAPDGTPTGALNGFFNTLLSVRDEYAPTDICVLFDLKAPTFRHKMSKDYKAQRKGMPPELSAQMPVVKDLLDRMGISRMEMEGYEADDLIGTLSRLGEEDGDTVYILSGDHDDYQLLSDKVSVIMPQSGKGKPPRILVTKEYFEEEYGVSPDVFVYVKALMGDNSDNIKGVDKVGEKTAFKLIAEYKDLEGVLANTDKMTPALAKNISASRELLDLNLKLCTIDRNVPVPYGIGEISFTDIKDRQSLYDELYRLSLKQLIKKLGLDNMKTSEGASNGDPEDPEIASLVEAFDAIKDRITIVSNGDITLKDKDVAGIDFTSDKALVALYGDPRVYEIDPERLYDLFSGKKDIKLVAFDYKNKSKIMSRALPQIDSVFDTAIGGYVFNLIDGNKPDFARLYESLFLRPYPLEDEDLAPKQLDLTAQLFGETEPAESVSLSAAKRLVLNLFVSSRMETLIREKKKEKLLYEIEFPLVVTLDAIERNGMYASSEMLSELHREFSERLSSTEQEIYDLTGETFNIGSTKQLAEVLFEKLHLPHGKKGKTGVYSTSIDELNRLREYHPAIDKIIEYRALAKLDSTYALGLQDKIGEDGRIRTTFTQAMTNTGRLSSTEPNLQNIPVRSSDGGRIRECFIAPEGRVLVDADYSQIELRLLAAMSRDEVMTDAFIKGDDIHKRTAMKVFGTDMENVTPKQRAMAKTVNFSIIYGISEYGLSNDLQISFGEAKQLIEDYGKQFPGITGYLESLKAAGEKLGYVETLFGRRRELPELRSQNRNLKNFGYRVAMNTPIQGTAADIIKIAMNRVYRALKNELPGAKLVMQVHDELIVECDEKDGPAAQHILKREMEDAMELSVPLVADVHTGTNWLEAK